MIAEKRLMVTNKKRTESLISAQEIRERKKNVNLYWIEHIVTYRVLGTYTAPNTSNRTLALEAKQPSVGVIVSYMRVFEHFTFGFHLVFHIFIEVFTY